MNLLDIYRDLHIVFRIGVIITVTVLASILVQAVQAGAQRLLNPPATAGRKADFFAQRHPKIATIISLVTSAITFTLYFVALGLVLRELNISLTAYLATASVVGLAVGFGSQGLVQDVVIGLTLVFSDAMDVGDMVEVSGQIGRVERVGLRFTVLINFNGQHVYVPNRNITVVSRYRGGVVRAYIDVEILPDMSDEAVTESVSRIAHAMRAQHPAIIVSDPEIFGIRDSADRGWRYLRLKLRLWPGQTALVETIVRQRLVAAMRLLSPDYADWRISVTYRVL